MKSIVHTSEAPAAIGPYSQGVFVKDILFVSGQLPIDPRTERLAPQEIALQTKQALENVQAVLESAGYSMSDIVKTTVFMKDLADFPSMNEVYKDFFTRDYPARAAVQVARLPKDALVEIEAIAIKQ
jgi:2-iminobutanoate/2-iminopropanoate deaminase